jgi:hypothetical protein
MKKHNKDLNLLSDEDIQVESDKRRSPHKPATEQVKKQPKVSDLNSDDEKVKLSRNTGIKSSESEPIEKPLTRNFGGIMIDQKENFTQQANNITNIINTVDSKDSSKDHVNPSYRIKTSYVIEFIGDIPKGA